jgi:DNA helicase IV
LRTSTVFKFKGMESYAVVLADLDSLATERDRRKAYVGISRAKYALYILASPAAEQALR